MSRAQLRRDSELQGMLSALVIEPDLAKKEAILNSVTSRFREAAGPGLLDVAIRAEDPDTRSMAIRGIGYVKFKGAAPKLIEWLASPEHYLRANAARALGEIRADAARPLIELLKNERDGGVIEQTAAALEMLHATEAVAALEKKADHPSAQTRTWVIGAVTYLGSSRELPFLVQCLSDTNIVVAGAAATGIERLTGQDFGSTTGHLSNFSVIEARVSRARLWWERTQGH